MRVVVESRGNAIGTPFHHTSRDHGGQILGDCDTLYSDRLKKNLGLVTQNRVTGFSKSRRLKMLQKRCKLYSKIKLAHSCCFFTSLNTFTNVRRV